VWPKIVVVGCYLLSLGLMFQSGKLSARSAVLKWIRNHLEGHTYGTETLEVLKDLIETL